MRYPLIILALLLLAVPACYDVTASKPLPISSGSLAAGVDASSPFSARKNALITLHPSRFTFEVPADWIEWNSQDRNNMHLSRDQLADVEKPENDEWDREFARACNAALPFDRCAAHVGSEGWGKDALSYGDLQVRVYDLVDTPRDLEDQIVRAASSVVRPEEVNRETDGVWRRVVVTYTRLHFDYEATAYVDFRVRRFSDRTLVFVFMYTSRLNGSEAIPRILNSVRRETSPVQQGKGRGKEGGTGHS
jgi:hypothetical protein